VPHGVPGGGGDIVANVFVLGQRFDFVTFEGNDAIPARGEANELGLPSQLSVHRHSRATLGMFGSGFIEMLARQMTVDLQAIRDATVPGTSRRLISRACHSGRLPGTRWTMDDGRRRRHSRTKPGYDRTIESAQLDHPAVPSGWKRDFAPSNSANNAFNHHHGIQTTERFGIDTDADGDGFVNEMTRADVTAVSLYQATLAVPGRVIPNDPEIEDAVLVARSGSHRLAARRATFLRYRSTGTDGCSPKPNPFNPAGNLRPDDVPSLSVDLTGDDLPMPRLRPVWWNRLCARPSLTQASRHHERTRGSEHRSARHEPAKRVRRRSSLATRDF